MLHRPFSATPRGMKSTSESSVYFYRKITDLFVSVCGVLQIQGKGLEDVLPVLRMPETQ